MNRIPGWLVASVLVLVLTALIYAGVATGVLSYPGRIGSVLSLVALTLIWVGTTKAWDA